MATRSSDKILVKTAVRCVTSTDTSVGTDTVTQPLPGLISGYIRGAPVLDLPVNSTVPYSSHVYVSKTRVLADGMISPHCETEQRLVNLATVIIGENMRFGHK